MGRRDPHARRAEGPVTRKPPGASTAWTFKRTEGGVITSTEREVIKDEKVKVTIETKSNYVHDMTKLCTSGLTVPDGARYLVVVAPSPQYTTDYPREMELAPPSAGEAFDGGYEDYKLMSAAVMIWNIKQE